MLVKNYSINLLFILFFTSCSLTPRHHFSKRENRENIDRLYSMLMDLNSTIDKREAKDLAINSISYAHQLSKEYRVVSPPLWHNTLVNIGIRERGLCYQWAEDMLLFFLKKRYSTLKFYIVGSSIGEYFEHNSLAVSAKGVTYRDSIVLDAWRYSGDLYFDYIKKDKYIWKNRENIYMKVVRRLPN